MFLTFKYVDFRPVLKLQSQLQQIETTLAWAQQQRQAQLLAEHRERQQRILIMEGHLPKDPPLRELFAVQKHNPRWVQSCWDACVGRNGTITPKKFRAFLRLSQPRSGSSLVAPLRRGRPQKALWKTWTHDYTLAWFVGRAKIVDKAGHRLTWKRLGETNDPQETHIAYDGNHDRDTMSDIARHHSTTMDDIQAELR